MSTALSVSDTYQACANQNGDCGLAAANLGLDIGFRGLGGAGERVAAKYFADEQLERALGLGIHLTGTIVSTPLAMAPGGGSQATPGNSEEFYFAYSIG